MTRQISVPFADKLDEHLADLCNGDRGLEPSERFPILVEYSGNNADAVVGEIERVGGTIRHKLNLVQAVAAWIPRSAIEHLAAIDSVVHLEMEQKFSIA